MSNIKIKKLEYQLSLGRQDTLDLNLPILAFRLTTKNKY